MGFKVSHRIASAIAAAVTLGFAIDEGLTSAQPTTALPLQLAQTTLTERANQIDTCRGTGNAALPIYKNTGLNGVVGSVPANSSITLTGVFGSGIVQIRAPQLGWVVSASLKADCSSTPPPDGGLPPDLDTNPTYCRRVRSSQTDGPAYVDLDNGLVARNMPNGSIQFVGSTSQPDGPDRAAIVRFPNQSTDVQDAGDRRWIRIKYTSALGTPRIGWVANGSVGVNRNLAACSN